MHNSQLSLSAAPRKWACCALALAALLVTMLPACNTARGLGKDIEATGDAIEDAAD